jgi:glycosyltransferase involved in cell wall biosynthesis
MTSRAATSPERSESPLFTIAIPTFNRAKWLRDCVASALSQTFSSFEVVVSDNASSDETPTILEQLNDRRLTVLRQTTNIGPIKNWNTCLNAANGMYVVMLSDDDTVARHFLKRCSSVMGDGVDISLVVAQGDVLDADTGRMRPATASRSLQSGIHAGTAILREFLRGAISPQMCTVAVKTETLRRRGGFPDGWPHAGDLVSWVPLLLQGPAGFVNESCGTHVSHEEAQSGQLSLGNRLDDIHKLTEVIAKEAEQQVDDPAVLAELKRLLRSYEARNLTGHIAGARRSGVSRRNIASVAWAWRRRIFRRGSLELRSLARPAAFFVLPLPVVSSISRLKHRVQALREARS